MRKASGLLALQRLSSAPWGGKLKKCSGEQATRACEPRNDWAARSMGVRLAFDASRGHMHQLPDQTKHPLLLEVLPRISHHCFVETAAENYRHIPPSLYRRRRVDRVAQCGKEAVVTDRVTGEQRRRRLFCGNRVRCRRCSSIRQ